jgi:hypothetical protein
VVGYLGFIALGFVSPEQPRIFWTMLLPLLPLGIVLMGFPAWRRLCPLAFFGEGGRRLERKAQRRVPAWLERWFLPFTFSLLLACLVLRLVATNGDARWLSALLVGLAVAAFAVNRLFTGKSWCNFFCPVGLVERIYTEPNSLRGSGNSQCSQCTACKKQCPDIDQENAYWKELTAVGRRFTFFAFPGLVLGFYVYYWLRQGDWEAYFDGRWTRLPVSSELAFGPGFFFAPGVPAWVAAVATLLVFSAVSYLVFRAVEWLMGRWVEVPERRRHLALTLAAFAAFNLFYLFAGAPTLRRIPLGTHSAAFVAPVLGSLFLVKRWRRTQAHFIGDRGAARLLRAWPFDEPPPSDPAEVYGWIQASRHAREKDLDAYSNVVREMIQDGLVRPGELKLLAGVRERLGISDSEHDAVLERLSEEERHLFEEGATAGIEERVQLEGYRAAMAEALVRGAGEEELVELQERFGVDAEAQGQALEQVRGASGELFSRAARQLERARALHADGGALGAGEPSAARLFLCHLLVQLRDRAVDRALDHFEAAGDTLLIQPLRRRLRDSDAGRRERALELLAMACPGCEELVGELAPLLARRNEAPSEPFDEAEILRRLLGDPSPFLRAAAAWVAVEVGSPYAELLSEELGAARRDSHELVRETVRKNLSPIETLSFLRTSPFFSRLEPADIYDLSFLAVEQTIAPGELVCSEGDHEPDALFVIVSGEAVLAHEESAKGERQPREEPVRRRGEMIGELSVLDGRPREATVRAGEMPLQLLRIQGESLRAALSRRPQVTSALLSTLAGRIRRLLH